MTAAIGPLRRGRARPAVLSVLALGGLVAAIAARYGFTFLFGTIAWASLDLVVLSAGVLRGVLRD
jgi:hypothetical protein